MTAMCVSVAVARNVFVFETTQLLNLFKKSLKSSFFLLFEYIIINY
jgi:hypothetical protein